MYSIIRPDSLHTYSTETISNSLCILWLWVLIMPPTHISPPTVPSCLCFWNNCHSEIITTSSKVTAWIRITVLTCLRIPITWVTCLRPIWRVPAPSVSSHATTAHISWPGNGRLHNCWQWTRSSGRRWWLSRFRFMVVPLTKISICRRWRSCRCVPLWWSITPMNEWEGNHTIKKNQLYGNHHHNQLQQLLVVLLCFAKLWLLRHDNMMHLAVMNRVQDQEPRVPVTHSSVSDCHIISTNSYVGDQTPLNWPFLPRLNVSRSRHPSTAGRLFLQDREWPK